MSGADWPRWFGPGFAPFGPWGRRSRFFEAGEVRIALLSLLEEGPRHGYELMKELEARSGGMYQASAGTVYPTLQQMEDEGLLSCEAQDGKKVYSLTEEGRQELEREAATVRRIWRRAESWEEWGSFAGPEVAEILGPVGGLMKAAFKALGRAGGDRATVRKVRDVLDDAREELERLAAEG